MGQSTENSLFPRLERCYSRYNREKYRETDPVRFVHAYSSKQDREVAGFIASCLAYGRVNHIIKSTGEILGRMGAHPHDYLLFSSPGELERTSAGFCHRFCGSHDMAGLILAMQTLLKEHGSLENVFSLGLDSGEENILPGLNAFYKRLRQAGFEKGNHLVPDPAKGSALKRLNLFLRWMVRKDAVDPGGWTRVSPEQLIVPLDTHMRRICGQLSLTQRKQADMRTALEVTAAFRRIAPHDPVRFDFSLTKASMLGKHF